MLKMIQKNCITASAKQVDFGFENAALQFLQMEVNFCHYLPRTCNFRTETADV